MSYVLTVSGSDSSGCAGMQADNRAIHAAGAMPVNVITANTLQTPAGVLALNMVEPAVVEMQMRALLEAYPIAAIKVGMLGGVSHVEAVARVLEDYPDPCVVLDPVILASSGAALLDEAGVAAMNALLMSQVDLVTPNLDEQPYVIPSERTAVLVKGGHRDGDVCTDVWIAADGVVRTFSEVRVPTANTRGTGCVLSSGIAAHVAQGQSLVAAYVLSRATLQASLLRNAEVAFEGSGPSLFLRTSS